MATKIIKAWIDGAVQEIEVEVMTSPEPEPELGATVYTTVTLPASAWVGASAPYSQVVTNR